MANQRDAFAVAGPVSRQLYKRLLDAMEPLGEFREVMKKTSLHLVRDSAFAGVHSRKQYFLIDHDLRNPPPHPRRGSTMSGVLRSGQWSLAGL